MRSSFYIVLWIIIYPLLDLTNNSFIVQHSFIVALAIILVLSINIKRVMPTLSTYDNAVQFAPILEDVYVGNIKSFAKRVKRDAIIENAIAVYLFIATLFSGHLTLKSVDPQLLPLIIFGFFTYRAISHSYALIKAVDSLKNNPTVEQCREIVSDVYNLDYGAYFSERNDVSFTEMLSPQPKYFRFYQIISIIFSTAAIFLGLFLIIDNLWAISLITNIDVVWDLGALLAFLYGSLAITFGFSDTISLIKGIKKFSLLTLGIIPLILILFFMPNHNAQITAAINENISNVNATLRENYNDVQLDSIFYDEDNKLIVNLVTLNKGLEELINTDYLKSIARFELIWHILYDLDRDFTKLLSDLNIGFKSIYSLNDYREVITTLSALEIKDLLRNPPTKRYLHTQQILIVGKAFCPMVFEEGITLVDVFEEGSNFIYLIEIDEEILDINEIFRNLDDYYEENRQSFLESFSLNYTETFKIFKELNTGVIYRFTDTNHRQTYDITITHDEM